jgi:hypothetical protein
MAQVWMMFKDCGASAYLVLLTTLIAVPLAIVVVILAALGSRAAKLLGVIALAASFGVAGLGVLGTSLGRSRTDAALSGGAVDPSMQAAIRVEGYREAGYCTDIGLGAAALPMILSAAGLVLAFAWKRPGIRATT